MLKYLITFSLFSMLFIASCGDNEEVEELGNALEMISKAEDIAENMEKNQNAAEVRISERKERGDTIALHFSELEKYLPTSISGYTAEEPDGTTQNMTGMSFSEVSKRFVSESDPNKDITVKIVDYNGLYDYWSALTAWVQVGYSVENKEGFTKTFNTGIDDVFAYEEYKYEPKRGNIFYAIGYRFYMTVEGDGIQSIDDLKNVASKVDLKKLAKM